MKKIEKNFNVENIEKTVANLVNINGTRIYVHHFTFDKNRDIIESKTYYTNDYCSVYSPNVQKSSLRACLNEIKKEYPNAYLNGININVKIEMVEITFHTDV